MSVESALLVRVAIDLLELRPLLADIRGAAARVASALPGDRIDVIRYEAMSSLLERTASAALAAGADSCRVDVVDRPGHSFYDATNADALPSDGTAARAWISAGDVAVEVRSQFNPGSTVRTEIESPDKRGPAATWVARDASGKELFGSAALERRFREQLQAAVDQLPEGAMRPSGVSNSVLTNGLREFVSLPGEQRDVPVIYQDGSTGTAFPLRSVTLGEHVPTDWHTYRFSLLSIRHTEMDAEVDGAWLRNTDISRPRPAGDTDQLVFDLSKDQLARMCNDGPALLYMHQTGLDTAIVGFYRAVVHHLMAAPGNLAVVPMFFRRQRQSHAADRAVAGYEPQSTFAEGKPWVV